MIVNPKNASRAEDDQMWQELIERGPAPHAIAAINGVPVSEPAPQTGADLPPLSERIKIREVTGEMWERLAQRFAAEENTPAFQAELWVMERETQLREARAQLAEARSQREAYKAALEDLVTMCKNSYGITQMPQVVAARAALSLDDAGKGE